MADPYAGSGKARPLSPHLSIYRLQVTTVLSGLHRLTGLGLVIGILLLTWWVTALADGEQSFAVVQWYLGSLLGQLLLLGWTFSLFYHLSNGIRHLLWDVGIAIDLPGIRVGAWVVLVAASGLTACTWLVAWL